MKNIFISMFMAVALFAAPLYPSYAQVASSTEEQVASLRVELINLLMKLIDQLQTQLDAQMAKNATQDEEIEVIKKTTSTRTTSMEEPVVFEAPVDSLAEARFKAGQIEAAVSVGEENIYFSVYNYLDADTVSFDANIMASSTEEGCGAIHDSAYKACATNVEYPIIADDLVINVTVNGVEKTLTLEPGKKSVVRVSWPN